MRLGTGKLSLSASISVASDVCRPHMEDKKQKIKDRWFNGPSTPASSQRDDGVSDALKDGIPGSIRYLSIITNDDVGGYGDFVFRAGSERTSQRVDAVDL